MSNQTQERMTRSAVGPLEKISDPSVEGHPSPGLRLYDRRCKVVEWR